jgi:hypothetical protein
LPSQQNLVRLGIALVVLRAPDNTFATLQPLMAQVSTALGTLNTGDVCFITLKIAD